MATGQYTRHRQNQRETILNAAEDLFIQKGIEQVSISDITKIARITRPTVYQYFSSKEEMAAEIFKVVTKHWAARNAREVWAHDGTGFEIAERFVITHITGMLEDKRETRFVAEFNYLYAKSWSAEQALDLIKVNLEADNTKLHETVKKGQSDGSIRSDIESHLLVAAIFNFNSSVLSRFGELGNKLGSEYELPAETIFSQMAHIFLDGLKA